MDVEREYFRKTRIFPPMHIVAIRRDVYEKNPWVAQSLLKAFTAAQKDAYAELARDRGAEIHASVAAAPRRRNRGTDGARLLALRL